jgi:hypothetical protein
MSTINITSQQPQQPTSPTCIKMTAPMTKSDQKTTTPESISNETKQTSYSFSPNQLSNIDQTNVRNIYQLLNLIFKEFYNLSIDQLQSAIENFQKLSKSNIELECNNLASLQTISLNTFNSNELEADKITTELVAGFIGAGLQLGLGGMGLYQSSKEENTSKAFESGLDEKTYSEISHAQSYTEISEDHENFKEIANADKGLTNTELSKKIESTFENHKSEIEVEDAESSKILAHMNKKAQTLKTENAPLATFKKEAEKELDYIKHKVTQKDTLEQKINSVKKDNTISNFVEAKHEIISDPATNGIQHKYTYSTIEKLDNDGNISEAGTEFLVQKTFTQNSDGEFILNTEKPKKLIKIDNKTQRETIKNRMAIDLVEHSSIHKEAALIDSNHKTNLQAAMESEFFSDRIELNFKNQSLAKIGKSVEKTSSILSAKTKHYNKMLQSVAGRWHLAKEVVTTIVSTTQSIGRQQEAYQRAQTNYLNSFGSRTEQGNSFVNQGIQKTLDSYLSNMENLRNAYIQFLSANLSACQDANRVI